jgi:dTDP-4-dehydrorhamnose reductase
MDLRNKKILITGAKGQLGSAIFNVFQNHKMNIIPTDRSTLDITNQQQVFDFISLHNPDVIMHCAAYTAVDKAEEDKENCYKTNVEGTRNLALICKKLDKEMIYFSTDYVFDGVKKDPYTVSDLPNPINYYGLTKYLGEELIRSLLTKFYIFRISWVFGPKGKNFVNTIIRLAKEKDSINIVNDQIGSPTYTLDVANYLLNEQNIKYGIHHLTNEGFISWFEFAKEIVLILKLKCIVNPISSFEYKTLAKRGLNSRMHKTIFLQNWLIALKEYLK